MPTRIMLVDDHRLFRAGLGSLLEAEGDLEVVAEAPDGRTAVETVGDVSPDVVVMDITMPELNGMEASRQILDRVPKTHIVALSMHSDRRFVEGMLRSGATGYLLKDCASDELVEAVRTVAEGRTFLSPSITEIVIESLARPQTDKSEAAGAIGRLSSREREVLQLLAEGASAKQIAHRLHLSSKTVETHRSNIMGKLDIHSIAELTKLAVREGLTPLEM